MEKGLTSLLDDILNEETLEIVYRPLTHEDTEDDLLEYFYDQSKEIKDRIIVLNELQIKDINLCIETVNKIISHFNFVPTSLNLNILIHIIEFVKIDTNLRRNCIEAVYNYNTEQGFKYYHMYLQEKDFVNLPFHIRLDVIKILMNSKYEQDVILSLKDLFLDKKYECEYRYKIMNKLSKESHEKFMIPLHEVFLEDHHTFTIYKILASQYLLQNKNYEKKNIFKLLASFCFDNDLDYNLRADSADMLMRLGDEKYKNIGKDIITLLGRDKGKFKTVYNNLQNVHDTTIDDSIRTILLQLSGMHTEKDENGNLITYDKVSDELRKLDNPKVDSSLLRIELDQTLYEGGQTLCSIFIKIYGVILKHPYKDELEKRLIEELIDMADTCTSGHVSRLINVLSGYEIEGKEYSINISWREQIRANLIARLQNRINNDDYYHKCDECDLVANYNTIDNRIPIKCSIHKKGDMTNYNFIEEKPVEFMRESILEELSISGSLETKHYLSYFFRLNLNNIREELVKEFVPQYLTEELFEEYFRNAICDFEEGN